MMNNLLRKEDMMYASFGKRTIAFVIDQSIILTATMVLAMAFCYLQRGLLGTREFISEAASNGKAILFFIIWLYYACGESSSSQATIGKKVMSVKVTDMNGGKISFGRASGRLFLKFVSGTIYGIGFFMALFTKKKQGLHDMIAKTLVVTKETDQSFFADITTKK